MNITVAIQSNETTREGCAPVNLLLNDGTRLCQIDLQYSKLASLGQPSACATDFLLLTAAVYALDKLVLRKNAPDCWHREFSVVLPVSDVSVWNAVKRDTDRCLSFLTGDSWNFIFVPQVSAALRLDYQTILPPTGDAVCLFSGGLDSLVGAIDWLELHNGRQLFLVGHHDEEMKGPLKDQKKILEKLNPQYPDRIEHILVRVGHRDELLKDRELTLRGRSVLFVALGIFVASALGSNIPLLIPENGTIALNVPLTPSRRGSCSTRTAHPYYLSRLRSVLTGVGLTNMFSNPLEYKTKGEAVAQCLNQQLLQETARLSVSCAKRGHPIHRTHSEAKSCGRCMPCIYRRAALHTVGWDHELYGDDVCQGEAHLDDKGEKLNDLRACLAFLRHNPTIAEISSMLMASGSLDVRYLPNYAAMVQMAMNEIRTLLRDKAIPEIKRLAGV